jgi:serine/threonine-protein kinase HipA
VPSLNVWMNGDLVGEWATLRSGTPVFRYTQAWTDSPRARALSISLPLTEDREIRGPAVDYYFDNLLPDNADIRSRIRTRFGLRSTDAFDLLEAIGRDCVGAVQLLPPDQEPTGWNRIETAALSRADVERHLRAVTAPATLGVRETSHEDDFRISLAGVQEKTALLKMGGSWFRPLHATPTTHILKLPLGVIGNFRGDFSDSVENEWLCAKVLRAFGLPVADAEIADFGGRKVLVVTRFDRRWIGADAAAANKRGFTPGSRVWIARLPQEDFCQATGRPPTRKYETDGGPGIADILQILASSEHAEHDRLQFVLAQLAFWLLAAIDGHAKNFSIQHRAAGAFSMTPLYDVLSAWPVIGNGANQTAVQNVKLAMSVRGRSKHYLLREIQSRHWHALARQVGGDAWKSMRELVESADSALRAVEADLPAAFPERVISRISHGVRDQARRFLANAPPP